jgi:serine/threonine protein kinase
MEDPKYALPAEHPLAEGAFIIDSVLKFNVFSVVYNAHDLSGQQVEVIECFPAPLAERNGKEVQPASDAQQTEFAAAVAQFIRDFGKYSTVSHPGLVKCHGVFEENGTAYAVFDHIVGDTLADIIADDQKALPTAELPGVLQSILEALNTLHGNGIMHRVANAALRPKSPPRRKPTSPRKLWAKPRLSCVRATSIRWLRPSIIS